jgi:dUTP pyrophosphatase
MENYDDYLNELKSKLESIKELADVDSDEDISEDLEKLLGGTFDELDEEFLNLSKTKTLKVKKLHPDAVLPMYNYPSDSGFDLHSVEEVILVPFGRALVPTGLSFQFDEGLEIQMRPKSGLAINQGLTILNTPGTIDQGYSGEVKAIVFNTNNHEFKITKGMKIAQAVLCPVINGKFVMIDEVNDLNETDRKDNGFGSTGII